MLTSAIGALHQNEIHILACHRISKQIVITTTNVTGEKKSFLLPVFFIFDIKNDLGTSQNMAGIDEGELNPLRNHNFTIVAHVDKLPQAKLCINWRVEGLNQRKALFCALLIHPLRVRLLNPGRIRQHHLTQVACCKSGINIPFKSLAGKIGEVATMINVRVGENDMIDALRVKVRETAIHLVCILSPPLVKSAVQENTLTIDF